MLQVLPLREEVAQLGADVAEEPGQAQGRKEGGLGQRRCRRWPRPGAARPGGRRAAARGGPRAARRARREAAGSGRVARDGLRVAAEEEVDLVLLGHDGPLDLGDLRRHLPEGAPRRATVSRAEAAPPSQPAVEEVVGVLEGRGGAPRDLELGVQLAQLEVGGGHVGDEREQHAAARLLGGEVVGARRLGQPADAPPEVELPGEADLGRPLRSGSCCVGVRDLVGAARASQPALVADAGARGRRGRRRRGRGPPPPAPPPAARRSRSGAPRPTRPFSTGSSKTSHQGRSARERASAPPPRSP